MSHARSLNPAIRRTAVNVTLSVPVQAGLLVSLCALTLWTFYFSSYPPAHNTMHRSRHSTAAVACH